MTHPAFAASIKRFIRDESGAVTVDWVVLTAAITMLGVGASFYITSSVPKLANSLSNYMESVTVMPD